MQKQLSVQQIFLITCELEPIVRDFFSALELYTPEIAFQKFDDDQRKADGERHILELDTVLSVAEEVLAKRELRGSEMTKTQRVVTDDVTQKKD